MANSFLLITTGFVAGVLSGLVGIGGGVILVPALVFMFHLSQHHAQGTTLAAFIPPIGLLAAWTYYKAGYVNLNMAGLICFGFLLGGFFGAKFAIGLPNAILQKIFGVIFLIVSIKMIFSK